MYRELIALATLASISIVSTCHAEPLRSTLSSSPVEMRIYNPSGGCNAEQCPVLIFACERDSSYKITYPYIALDKVVSAAKAHIQSPKNEGGIWKKGSFMIEIGHTKRALTVRNLTIDFSEMDGYSTSATLIEEKEFASIIRAIPKAQVPFTTYLFGIQAGARQLWVTPTDEHRENFVKLNEICNRTP